MPLISLTPCDESHTEMTDTKLQDSTCLTDGYAPTYPAVAGETPADAAEAEDTLEAALKAMLDGAGDEDALEAELEKLERESDAREPRKNSASENATERDGTQNAEESPDAPAGTPSDDWPEDADGLWASDDTVTAAAASSDDTATAAAGSGKTQAEREAEDKKLRAESYKIMANMGNFTLYFIVALIFTWFIGTSMDEFFNTKPVFTIFWIACGIASTVLEVRKTILAAKKLGETDLK